MVSSQRTICAIQNGYPLTFNTETAVPADRDDRDELSPTFANLGLPDDLLATVSELGYETPSPIQAETIPALLSGRDVVGVAQTGTGKTAAFGLPLIARIDPQAEGVQALVLAPTRELAMQGAEAIESFAAKRKGIRVLAVYGGSPYPPQLRALKEGVQVVVGTPGRIMDLMEREALQLSHVHYFVLDEADEMLRMGFAEDVEKIASDLPKERVSALFSATMPNAIRRVAETHLHDPLEITVTPPASTVDTVTQEYAVVPSRHKVSALARVLAVSEADAAIVFVRTRATAEDLAIELGTRGVATAALSGDVAQKDRERLVSRLREGTLDVLVATDVAARGLDVERIGLVINFDVPREADTYVHRIGRTGRAGREGRSLTFVTARELSRLRRIAKQTKSKMKEISLPTAAEVSRQRAHKLVEKAMKRFEAGRLGVYRDVLEEFDRIQAELAAAAKAESEAAAIPDVATVDADADAETSTKADTADAEDDAATTAEKKPAVQMSREELILSLLALGVRDPGPSGDDAPDNLQEDTRDDFHKKKRQTRSSGRSLPGATRYRVEVGHKDRVKPGAIVGAITGEGGIAGSDLGNIDIFPTFSLVEIGVPLSPEARRRISDATIAGRQLRIREDTGPRGGGERRGRREGGRREGGRRGGYRGGRGGSFGGRQERGRQGHRERRGWDD
ncbi:DEAD/DEAH box helicase [Actinobaculum suis]|uniref:RNA helicase n=1 Tax=Actinobaculum suis TaxID=1657 RepID=A0A7Z8YAB4_9ACTO|nr:DEAD/DEAH box helicase [Actinobaculum suis]